MVGMQSTGTQDFLFIYFLNIDLMLVVNFFCLNLSFSGLNLGRQAAFPLKSIKRKHHANLCACASA